MSNEIEWLEPWYRLDEKAHIFENELNKEIGENHILYGKRLRVIGRREDRDDILVEINDSSNRIAVVHLTYNGMAEKEPYYPRTRIFANLDEWIEKCLKYDHWEYTLDDSN